MILLFLAMTGAQAQIQFETGTLAAALAKGKKENKPVFVDVYAVWCGPCKRMAATAFKDPQVSAYYNENFISIQIDAEHAADGPSTAMTYQVNAYPTLLYFTPDGQLAKKVVGAMDAQMLLARGEEVAYPEKSPGFITAKAYHDSKKTRNDLKTYIGALIDIDSDSADAYTATYYQKYKDLNLDDEVEFEVFFMQENDPESALGKQFIEHPEKVDPSVYAGKIQQFVQESFTAAVEAKDFSIVEKTIRLTLPHLQKAMDGVPDVETYLQYVRSEYDKQVN